MNNQRKISRGLTPKQRVCVPNIYNKIKSFDAENATIANINSLYINADTTKINSATIGKISIGYDTDTDSSYLRVPNNFSIHTNDGNEFVFTNNGDIILQKLNVADTIESGDGKFVGNIEATNVSLLGDITSTNSHITNQLNVDGNILGQNITASNLTSSNVTANNATFNAGLTTGNILVNGITETPQVSSKADLTLSVGPDHTLNVPNIRYNIDLGNNHVIGPAEIKLSKIFIANGDVRLVADNTCDGMEVIIFNNTIVNIRVTGPQLITTIPQKTIKKFLYLALIQKWLTEK